MTLLCSYSLNSQSKCYEYYWKNSHTKYHSIMSVCCIQNVNMLDELTSIIMGIDYYTVPAAPIQGHQYELQVGLLLSSHIAAN